MVKTAVAEKLKKMIRDVPDFPKKGIIFKDITTLLKDHDSLRIAVDTLVENYKGKAIDQVVSVESRGFILGSILAYKLGAGFVPVRKVGKLPHHTERMSYDLEYGQDTLEIHRDAITKGTKVLIVDDLLATGGTASAVAQLIERLGGQVISLAFLVELVFLKGRDKLKGHDIFALIKYE